MGYRGPIPKPSSIARAEGNPGKRRLNDCEPQPRNVAPKCPAHLDERARKEWKRLGAQEKLSELGILYKAPSGYVMQSPLLAVVNQCVDTITKLSREFGLTPAARSRIIARIDEEDPQDELMRILNTPRGPRDFSQAGAKPQ